MMDCKSMPTPMMMNLKKMNEASSDSDDIDPNVYRQLIGSLMYLVNTRPDICYAMNGLSQFMIQPIQTQWITTENVLIYLRGTVRYGLRYSSSVDLSLQGYVDWAGSIVDQKRTSGCCFTLGSRLKLNNELDSCILCRFIGIFHHAQQPYRFIHNRARPSL
jgi:hypothetical protein